MKASRKQYLKYLNPLQLIQTKKVLKNNPTVPLAHDTGMESILSLFKYNQKECLIAKNIDAELVNEQLFESGYCFWLNSDIINKSTVEQIGKNLNLHYLIVEDILGENERPKLDEIDEFVTVVMQMLYYKEDNTTIENEQVSFVLSKNFVVSFQDDSLRDSFDAVREKLNIQGNKLRSGGPDYLLYALIDSIVDQYFVVLEKLGDQVEKLEEEITNTKVDQFTMNQINYLRKELIFFKRNAAPVKDLLSSIIKSENTLIKENTIRYFKDVYDHIVQINDLTENYRDVITNIRDLYLSQMNMKMNEVMKFLAIVTSLLAPATVIGGIFGMNFDRIPYLHDQNGFWIATGIMLIIPILMMVYFKRKGWY
ncbi:MAG: magnesium/cobalt transporter CorA [Chitinophagaceae bacterium]|nr:magnesium/cobalt transporter CorA [Chitinophagaceae bacterium]